MKLLTFMLGGVPILATGLRAQQTQVLVGPSGRMR